MKVRDLLRKVVNNEELPLKVKIRNRIYEYDYTTQEYECNDPMQRDANEYYQDALFIFCWSLDQEVEIIEEEQDIEKISKLSWQQVGYQTCYGDERPLKDVVLDFNKQNDQMGKKINELIKTVNELKKNEK